MRGLAWIGPCLVAIGCSSGVRPPPLHELPAWAGEVQITAELPGDRQQTKGELVFDRAAGNLQLTLRGATTIALTRSPAGEVRAFENGVPRAATEAEIQHFQLVRTAVELAPGPARKLTAVPGGYVVHDKDLVLTVLREAATPTHGKR